MFKEFLSSRRLKEQRRGGRKRKRKTGHRSTQYPEEKLTNVNVHEGCSNSESPGKIIHDKPIVNCVHKGYSISSNIPQNLPKLKNRSIHNYVHGRNKGLSTRGRWVGVTNKWGFLQIKGGPVPIGESGNIVKSNSTGVSLKTKGIKQIRQIKPMFMRPIKAEPGGNADSTKSEP